MGVIYKLKPEIIHFIVHNKKKSPSLSCRALADLVQESFQQKVSKSSINKILKTEKLSSPVGRPGKSCKKSAKSQKKAFKISGHKKKEIFEDASRHSILSDLKPCESGAELVDGVGCIFLKASEWELARESVLKEILHRDCSCEDAAKLDQVSRVLGFLKAFHIESLESLSNYQGSGLWKLNGISAGLTESDILSVLESIQNKEEFFLKFSLKIPQIFTQASGFRFILSDGSSFFLDGQSVCLWKNVQQGFPVSLGKAVTLLSKIFNNVHSVVLNSISPKMSMKTQDYYQIFDFLGAFNNVQSKKIQKIELIAEDREILGCFDEVPQINRTFIAGLWPWENLFQRFLEAKSLSRETKINQNIPGLDLFCKEAVIKEDFGGKNRNLRGVMIFEPFMQVPFLILLTNMDIKEVPAQDVVINYCRRWPNMEKSVNFSMISDPLVWKNSLLTERKPFFDFVLKDTPYGRDPVWLVIEQFLSLLDRFCRRQFFPETYQNADFSTMQNRFYGLPGKIMETESKYTVNICPPDSFPHIRDLVFASERLNESGIETFEEKQVFVDVI